ncbi:MAG: hypothetical protein CO098_19665 [Bacteroidetes bacterium CG_4_9_14_3_um_filter_41_19]|nr:MAG: hypothetical protein CO098_19665 [Bacteroidetes bacterium CG_4_9_14_3_um_filter_41_19]
MKKHLRLFGSALLLLLSGACTQQPGTSAEYTPIPNTNERSQIIYLLDSFNNAAASADFEQYFNCFAEEAVFIGTDATEYWTKEQFMIWAKPYFDQGKAWSFQSMERHIYFNQTGNTAWFDELLNTQMSLCRGSGVLTKQNNVWKIQQYVLSMTIPNNATKEVVRLKGPFEEALINELVSKHGDKK